MNDPLCLKDSFGNLAKVLPVFDEEEAKEKMGGHVVSKLLFLVTFLFSKSNLCTS